MVTLVCLDVFSFHWLATGDELLQPKQPKAQTHAGSNYPVDDQRLRVCRDSASLLALPTYELEGTVRTGYRKMYTMFAEALYKEDEVRCVFFPIDNWKINLNGTTQGEYSGVSRFYTRFQIDLPLSDSINEIQNELPQSQVRLRQYDRCWEVWEMQYWIASDCLMNDMLINGYVG